METVDLLVTGARQLVTLRGEGEPSPRAGRGMSELGIIRDGAFAAKDGRIVRVGSTEEVSRQVRLAPGGEAVDASGRVVTPGFVDAHTHAVFEGSRPQEFEARLQGSSYQEIAAQGGGIRSSVRAFRAATTEQLKETALERLDRMLELGSTTVEIKSGYGLSLDDELRALEVARELDGAHPVDVIPTFLGAHEIPEEFASRRDEYVALVAEEMVPEVSRRELALFCDVFCEEGVFTVEESERVLVSAKRHGLGLKIHAEEFTRSGGAALAARLGATSAEHLLEVNEDDIAAMREAGVVAVLLPGVSFSLGLSKYAPARTMIEMGLPVALATDCNPGSSMTESMQMIVTLACVEMRMTAAEALAASTSNAAFAVGLGMECGSLEAGKRADALVLNMEDYRELPYHYGVSNVQHVIKNGRLVVRSGLRVRS
ncbi:MAG: imidazolonepropionase [Candidatus Eiseniibacteriota bacterium]|nr:MAG: imidazolonepropionase [Candidatus Eisenbacteria bacterium]